MIRPDTAPRSGAPHPAVLTVAGSDSSGGAGIQADLRTFAAHGVEGAAAVTAVTAQDTVDVREVHVLPAGFVACQVEVVLADLPVRAAKAGLLASPAIADALAPILSASGIPWVLDPVLAASGGRSLAQGGLLDVLRRRLLPLARLVTPNLPEAAALLGVEAEAACSWSRAEREDAARRLLGCGARAILLKGGHSSPDAAAGGPVRDLLATEDGLEWVEGPRVATAHRHGTGCVLSAAVAARLALGEDLRGAVIGARAFLGRALRAAGPRGAGRGSPDVSLGLPPAAFTPGP